MNRYLLFATVFSLGAFLTPQGAFAAPLEGFGSSSQDETAEYEEEFFSLENELEGLLQAELDMIARLESQIADMKSEEDRATATAILNKIKSKPSPRKRERMLNKLTRLVAQKPEKRSRILADIRKKHFERQQETHMASAGRGRSVRSPGGNSGASPLSGDFAPAAPASQGSTGWIAAAAAKDTGSSATPSSLLGDSYTEIVEDEYDAIAADKKEADKKKDKNDKTAGDKTTDPAQNPGAETGQQGGGGGGGGMSEFLKKLTEGMKPEDIMKMAEQYGQAINGSQAKCIVNAGKARKKDQKQSRDPVADCVAEVGKLR